MVSDLVQISFDYGTLTPEQSLRTQDAELRIIGRTQKAIIENGKDLLAVKQDIGHGHFLNWMRSLGISEKTAENWMNVAENFSDIRNGYEFENRALYLLSTSKVPESARDEAKRRAEEGEKITEEIARQIRDAHKAKEQAELAELQAREGAKAMQQRLFVLEQEMLALSKPDEVIKEVDKPETKARLEKLEAEVTTLTLQRDNLSKLTEELSADLDVKEAEREREARDARLRQEWQKLTDGMYKAVTKFIGQLPMPLDTQVFEAEDWERLDQMIEGFQRAIEACRNMHGVPALMVVDAR